MEKKFDISQNQLQPIIERSVQDIFTSFLGFAPTIKGSETTYVDARDRGTRAISGVMAFIQEEVEGTLSISFSKDTAIKTFSTFYGETLTSFDDPRVTEGVAELANVIHGVVKEQLNTQGFNFQMCLPLVVIGNNHTVFSPKSSPVLQVQFDSQFGEIVIEVIFHHAESKRLAA